MTAIGSSSSSLSSRTALMARMAASPRFTIARRLKGTEVTPPLCDRDHPRSQAHAKSRPPVGPRRTLHLSGYAAFEGQRPGRPRCGRPGAFGLRRRVGEPAAEDVRVPERRRALLLDIGRVAFVLGDRVRLALAARLLGLRGLLAGRHRLVVE